MQMLPPSRFRFKVEDDVAAYGDDWRIWDEEAIFALPGRELIALEAALGMPLPAVVDSFHARETLGLMAAMWIALHLDGHPVKWDDFDPIAWETTWEKIPAAPLEDPDSTESPTAHSTSSPGPAGESVTSS